LLLEKKSDQSMLECGVVAQRKGKITERILPGRVFQDSEQLEVVLYSLRLLREDSVLI
jgi:hypothetical protein